MSEFDYTLEDLLACVNSPLGEPQDEEGYYSSKEWAEIWGRGLTNTRAHIATLLKAGIMEAKEIRGRSVLDGRSYRKTVYRINEEKYGQLRESRTRDQDSD